MEGCNCKRALLLAAGLSLVASLASAKITSSDLVLVEDSQNESPPVVGFHVPTPRGGDGCTWDNGPLDMVPETNVAYGTQQDPTNPLFAQVADDFNLNCAALACEGDANGDGTVDPLDSGYVLARLGCDISEADCQAADQNGDGEVDPLDAGFVLARFGDCPAAGDPGQALITQIKFYATHYNPIGCGDPDDWHGVRVVVYNDAGGIPDGEPVDDGTILGGPPAFDTVVAPSALSWTRLDLPPGQTADFFEVIMETSILVDNGVTYWLAISPQRDFVGGSQTGWWNTSAAPSGLYTLHQIFGVAGLPDWTDRLIDAAFTLTAVPATDTSGACCSAGACLEGVDVLDCQEAGSRFLLGGSCGDLDPSCDAGACCAPDGACTQVVAGDCAGVFQGAGTSCNTTDCPQPAPANDDCANAIALSDGTLAINTGGATTDGPVDGVDVCGYDFVGNNDVWFTYTATCDGGLIVSLCGLTCGYYDTTLQIYSGTSCDPLGEQLDCGDDDCAIGGGPSEVKLCTVNAGDEFLIRLGGWKGAAEDPANTGDALIDVSCEAPQDCCAVSDCTGCADDVIEACVCANDPFCCESAWEQACVDGVEIYGCGECP